MRARYPTRSTAGKAFKNNKLKINEFYFVYMPELNIKWGQFKKWEAMLTPIETEQIMAHVNDKRCLHKLLNVKQTGGPPNRYRPYVPLNIPEGWNAEIAQEDGVPQPEPAPAPEPEPAPAPVAAPAPLVPAPAPVAAPAAAAGNRNRAVALINEALAEVGPDKARQILEGLIAVL
jgi:pyruvate/2-oxoglutarate dehydrogenase complex dihydrolipoamide acyltransferase (E2) component